MIGADSIAAGIKDCLRIPVYVTDEFAERIVHEPPCGPAHAAARARDQPAGLEPTA